MKNIVKKLKYRFYKQGITKRIIIVITALSIFSNLAFIGSVFVIMRHQLINKTIASNQKDVEMVATELNMFFEGIRNDSLSLIVSEACQTLLSNFEEFLKEDTKVQYQRYKLIQTTIMSTVGQRPIYNTIIFYDIYGNPYTSDGLIASEKYSKEQQSRIEGFLKETKKETVLSIHKSPWRKKKDAEYADCISYLRKVYHAESGRLIGVVEFEIPNSALCKLYLPVMEGGNRVYIAAQEEIISSAHTKDLYTDLQKKDWYGKLKNVVEKESFKVLKNNKKIYLMKEYPEHKWVIINAVPTSTYMKDILFYAMLDLLIGGVLLVANLCISNILIVSLTKPISKITNAMEEIGSGNYNRRVHVKDGGEIGTLADEFNRMLDKTETLMTQIVEKEQEKRESELSLIQMQMTPHFFYNILESICGLIVIDDKKTAIHTISLLSRFYRGVLNKGKEMITVREELDIAINYLEIMKICHPGKFSYIIECPPELEDHYINKLTLQPILENSIHHGFKQMSKGGTIGIRCFCEGENLILELDDNGCGLSLERLKDSQTEGHAGFHMESFGLRNTDERIKLFFGSEYGISIGSQIRGSKIRIVLPADKKRGNK